MIVQFAICLISIYYSKQLNKYYIMEETSIIKEINEYFNKVNFTEDYRSKLLFLHSQLDKIFMRKAKEAYIRLRAEWMEKGKKNSYF